MIKYLILLFTLSLFSEGDRELLKKLSPLSENLYLEISNGNLDSSDYLINYLNDTPYIGALFISNSNIDDNVIDNFRIVKGASIDTFYSIKIPLSKYIEFCNSHFFKYLQIDEPVYLDLDSANFESNFVNAGIDFRNSEFFESSGVVVGIVDYGFQFDHIMFNNSSGATRVKKAWLQNYNSPNRPENYDYGTEITAADFSRIRTDSEFDSHGTHVAGIAAGSQFPGTSIQGVASEADLVFVSPIFFENQLQATSQSAIIDGIDYIFKEASRLGKPCVINLSLGNQIGPHDGKAIFDQMATALQNSSAFGRSLVTSAGNDGERRMTIKKVFQSNTDTLRTLFDVVAENSEQFIDIWGEPGNEICVTLGIPSGNSIKWDDNIFCTSQAGNTSGILSGNNRSFRYQISLSPSEIMNGKPRVFITTELLNSTSICALKVISNGTTYIWNCFVGGSQGDDFYSGGFNGYLSGTRTYQIGEIGGNSQGFVTVASHNSKNSFTNIRNNTFDSGSTIGEISSFSSIGPNADEFLKPDISAPGNILISSYNKYDQNNNTLSPENTITNIDNSSGDLLGALSGTSMSSPIVAGTIALMLRANPFLSQNEIKYILKEASFEDSFTGSLPIGGSSTWGFGKLDAYETVRRANEAAKMIELFPEILVGPNPFNDNIKLKFGSTPTNKKTFTFADRLGRIIYHDEIPLINEEFIIDLNTADLAQGVYYLNIETDRFARGFVLIKLIE